MYIESEFALLEANNEQLTRENKKLVEALETSLSWMESLEKWMDYYDWANKPKLKMDLEKVQQALAQIKEE